MMMTKIQKKTKMNQKKTQMSEMSKKKMMTKIRMSKCVTFLELSHVNMESQDKYLMKRETNASTNILLQCARNMKIMETLKEAVKIVIARKNM